MIRSGEIVWYSPKKDEVYPVFVLEPTYEDHNLVFKGIHLDNNFIPISTRWTNFFKSGVEKARGMKLPPVVSEAHYLLYFQNFLKIEDWR